MNKNKQANKPTYEFIITSNPSSECLARQMALPTPLTTFPEHSCCPSSVPSCHLDGEKTALVSLITMTNQFKKLLLFLIEGAVGGTQPTNINKHYPLPSPFLQTY